jgi:hypothetical protein
MFALRTASEYVREETTPHTLSLNEGKGDDIELDRNKPVEGQRITNGVEGPRQVI